MPLVAMDDAPPNFNGATHSHASTLLPPWQYNPTSSAGASFHAGSFPADTTPRQLSQSAQTWSQNAINASPWIASVDALANGVDIVSAAFLQLVEFHERSQLDKPSSDLLRSSLRNGYLTLGDLLSVVDWERLQNLAVSCVFPPLSSNRLGYLGSHDLPNQTTPRDFSHSDGTELLPFPLYEMPTTSSSSTASSSLFTPWPGAPLHPATQSTEPGVHPATEYYEQPLAQTPHTGVIVDSGGSLRRRCFDCGEEDDPKQWRKHPEIPGDLCNSCGQHRKKYGTPRSPQLIKRGKERANRKRTRVMSTHPKHPLKSVEEI
ncbi:hypothetical protein MSAN_01731300 [Mycena sanguinolenta]|uniref:GATA-type domain-containing protein n=1 Tax=Mycena sanguinolenta TaxID=230812 RepID=A0A8H6XZW7_9AGAR|nr:hypothetical protein MSAN_01731300 [Mycena sanguinolenta]